jgi:hypothetical protein
MANDLLGPRGVIIPVQAHSGDLPGRVSDMMNEPPRIVLNLADVTHIYSNGIGMLCGVHPRGKRRLGCFFSA